MLLLRSSDLGTIEPFLIHLLKGVVIFETLIKVVSTKNSWMVDTDKNGNRLSNPTQITTIGKLGYCSGFKSKYCTVKKENINDLSGLLGLTYSDKTTEVINITYMLRNSVAHDLRKEDVFANIANYDKLFASVIDAIFVIIRKEYL